MSDNEGVFFMAEMKAKQRILGALRGEPVDRIPWSPFLAYYWDFVDAATAEKGQFAFMRELGADPLLRGFYNLYAVQRKQCEIHDTTHGIHRQVIFETRAGKISEQYTYAPVSNTWFLTKYPVASAEDMKVLQFIYENTMIEPDRADFDHYWHLYGDDALILPAIGSFYKTGIQSMVEHWLGTEELAYALMDYPEAIGSCLEVMALRDRETVEVSLDSQAEGFIFYEDSSTTNLSPETFARYALPQINEWGKMIHAAGKLLVHHACGHLRDLLPLMAESEVDAIESISPPPTGNIEIRDALARLPEHIALIGGIEPTVLLNSSLEEFEPYVLNLLAATKDRRFVLANSDSCPPFVAQEKFQMVSRLVRR